MSKRMSNLPAQLVGLEALSGNLRWSWAPGTHSLFERLDADLWSRSHHNPVKLINDQSPMMLSDLAADTGFVAAVERELADLEQYLDARGAGQPRRIAYFSAEFATVDCIRVFSGGLGVLAGDHLKSASDLGLPLAAVGLLYREGYFTQHVDGNGRQHEAYRQLDPEQVPLTPELASDGSPVLVSIGFPGRTVSARIWRADVGVIPLYLLDTDVPQNSPVDRRITDRLYGGDLEHRLEQELVLGIGGVRALEILGHDIETWHLNEGHAAFVAFERLFTEIAAGASVDDALNAVREQLVFTTHTPVEAGHDYFTADLMHRYFAETVKRLSIDWDGLYALGVTPEPHRAGQFCMTALALRCARTANGVSALHGRVSRSMWRGLYGVASADEVPIGHVTNGVHLPTWVGPAMADVYAGHVAQDWRYRSSAVDWSRVLDVAAEDLWSARRLQRGRLIHRLRRVLAEQAGTRGTPDLAGLGLDPDALTITFARRFATYKRATLPLSDLERLAAIVGSVDRPVQLIYAGKAHPRDEPGKGFIHQVFSASRMPEMRGRIVFVENYDAELARYLVHGSDVWLNLPRRPLEASGTSGMKSAANGGLNLSVTDGWWAEAWTQHNALAAPIGWAIESAGNEGAGQDTADSAVLYSLLEDEVVPLFYDRDERGVPRAWVARVAAAMAQVCGYFNTNRMVEEYAQAVYRLEAEAPAG